MAIDRRALAPIFAGGALGSAARTGLAELVPTQTGHWPWVTFSVNVVGCFLLGYFVTRRQERLPVTRREPFLGPTRRRSCWVLPATLRRHRLLQRADQRPTDDLLSRAATRRRSALADQLLALYERHGIHTSVLLREADGFGSDATLHTDRRLSASESLPAVAIAIDEDERIAGALDELRDLAGGCLTDRADDAPDCSRRHAGAAARRSKGAGQADAPRRPGGQVRGRSRVRRAVELLAHRGRRDLGLAGGRRNAARHPAPGAVFRPQRGACR